MRNLPLASALAVLLAGLPTVVALPAQQDVVHVFVLAGQSNMEGKAQNALLERQAAAEATAATFAPFRRDGRWIERDDVFVKFFDRHGPLTVGYGSPGRTGCELGFGCRVGDHLEAPALLIKTAWGGRSLRKDFRPPSAGLPADAALEQELAQLRAQVEKRNADRGGSEPLPTMAELRASYGRDYRLMLDEVRATLDHCDTLFPALKGKPKKLAGFVWFQGWNDQYGGAELEYEANLRHLIRDVRRDLDAADLPFVVGVMGQNGPEPAKGAMRVIQEAQLAVAATDELENVRAVRTDALVDEAAWALYPQWRERREEWDRTGSDHPYHYLGSAIWFTRIGAAFAEAMIGMIG